MDSFTDDSINVLAHWVKESMLNEQKEIKEPFEVYANNLKRHMCLHMNDFEKRFKKGYEVLCESVEQVKEE